MMGILDGKRRRQRLLTTSACVPSGNQNVRNALLHDEVVRELKSEPSRVSKNFRDVDWPINVSLDAVRCQ